MQAGFSWQIPLYSQQRRRPSTQQRDASLALSTAYFRKKKSARSRLAAMMNLLHQADRIAVTGQSSTLPCQDPATVSSAAAPHGPQGSASGVAKGHTVSSSDPQSTGSALGHVCLVLAVVRRLALVLLGVAVLVRLHDISTALQ